MRITSRLLFASSLLLACGDDGPGLTSTLSSFTSVSGGGSNDSMGPGGDPGPTEASSASEDDPTGGPSEPTDGTTDAVTSGPTDPTEGGEDPCDGVDCSGHGSCVDMAGAPACDCDDGYIAEGVACIACAQVEGVFDIDIPMITVTGAKTVNGQTPNAPDSGYLSFVNRTTGDSVSLGTFYANPYDVDLIPGTYDIVYDYGNFEEGIPRNNRAVIQEGVVLTSSKDLAIDVPMVTITGAKTINGQAPNAPDSGYLSFVNRDTGDSASLGTFYSNPYSVNLVPGTYDLVYDYGNFEEGIPRNNHAVLQEGIDLTADKNLAIDIPMVTITGAKTVNGQAPNAPDSGYLSFVNRDTGDSASLGTFYSNPYSVNLVPGTYDLVYDYGNFEEGIPRNNHAVVQEGLVLTASKDLDIDIPMVTITGAKTINGQAPNAPDSGYLSFVNAATGDSVSLGTFYSNPYSVNLVPGTYDLVYDYGNFAEDIPRNNRAVLQTGLVLTADKNLAIDIPMITVTGAKTVNGQTPDAPDSGYLSFVDRATGDSVSLGTFYTNPYSVNLVPGVYDIVYDYGNFEEGIPRNNHAVIQEGVDLTASKSLAIDIPMVSLGGTKTVNGQVPSAPDSGYLSLVDRLTGDSVSLSTFYSNPYSVNLVPGTYRVVYDYGNFEEGIPRNNSAELDCVQVR